MLTYQGKSVFGGIAIGRIKVYRKDAQTVKRVRVEDPRQEAARFLQAKETAAGQLQALYEKACKEVGEDNAAIYGEMLGFDEAKLAELKEKGVI